ncbi:hypothetical protein V2I01_04920 [Micromonospora sp. BRA006-A]|nr:hypothetical protein [Micromonospora sp. BRA006-A]
MNIIDEAFAYTPEQHSALLYTVSSRPNPQFIYTSSPPLTGDTGDIMFALRQRGDQTAPRVAEDGPWEQDPSLGYRDWGLAGDLDHLDDLDLDDMALAAASNPALGIRRSNGSGLTHETVARERRATKGDPAGYARERLGIWPRRATGKSGVIADEVWRRQRDRDATTRRRWCVPAMWCSWCRSTRTARTRRSLRWVPGLTGRCWRRSWITGRVPGGRRAGWRT